MKKISVIIPVYNVNECIQKSMESVIGQTIFSELEIIMIDDGSTDGSQILCDVYAKKYKNINCVHQHNQGVSRARNRGLELATSQYIAFFDPDDVLELDMYEKMYNDIKNNNADIVSVSLATKGWEPGKLLGNREYVQEGANNIVRDFLQHNSFTTSVTDKLFKKDTIKDIFFNPNYKTHEDGVFVYYALKNSKKVYYDTRKVYYHYIFREGSAQNPSSGTPINRDRITALFAVEEIWKDVLGTELRKYGEFYYIHFLISFLKAAYRCGVVPELIPLQQKIEKEVKSYNYIKNRKYFPKNDLGHKMLLFGIYPRLSLWILKKVR